MTDTERRTAARQFTTDWTGRGDEKQETAQFWTALPSKVYDIVELDKFIQFGVPVRLDHTSYNDRAVMQAYGFSVKDMTESKCVAELMKLY